MIVTMIGSASGCSTVERESAGIYIQSSKNTLLDCGEGVNKFFLQRDVDELDAVCITHAHLDHFIGLPMLLFHNFAIRGRTKPLTIIAPNPVGIFMDRFYEQYHIQPDFKIQVKYYHPNYMDKQWQFKDVYVTAFQVKHSMPECYGYDVYDKSEGKSIVYTGDTEPMDSLPLICETTDLVIAEGTWASDYTGPRYGHSWVTEMIETVDQADTSKLVLTHISQRYHSEAGYSIYSADVAAAFQKCENLKRIYIAYDGLEITI